MTNIADPGTARTSSMRVRLADRQGSNRREVLVRAG
jgi:hypothetical protein